MIRLLHRLNLAFLCCAILCSSTLLSVQTQVDKEVLFREMQQSLIKAEALMGEERFEEASQLLEKLIAIGQDVGFDSRSYLELSMRLAETYAARNLLDKSELLLRDLLAMGPPDDLYLRMELLRSRVVAERGNLGEVYANLMKLNDRIPADEWAPEDRDYFERMTAALNHRWEDLILRAERLFASALYEESIQVFTEIVKGINSGMFPKAQQGRTGANEILAKLRHRLAESYFIIDNYPGAVTVLSNIHPRLYVGSSELQEIYRSDLFLLGSASRRMGDFEVAERSLSAYIAYGETEEIPRRDEAIFELGLAYLDTGKKTLAYKAFDELKQTGTDPHYRQLADIHQARVDLEAGNYDETKRALGLLETQLDPSSPLHYEVAYLHGEALYQSGDYEAAISAYSRALPEKNEDQAEWSAKARYNIGWAYLELGDSADRGSPQQQAYFDRAESAFTDLLEQEPSGDAFLALGRGYLRRGLQQNDRGFLDRVERLLDNPELFQTPEQRAAALAIRAEAADSYDRVEQLYAELTSDKFIGLADYAEGWYGRGLNHFKEAQEYHKRNQRVEADNLYQEAIIAFYTAFDLLKEQNRAQAGKALNLQAQAYFQLGTYEGKYMAFSLLESLLQQYRDVYTAMHDQDEILYYRGLTASHLMAFGESERFAEIAEESLCEVIDHWGQGRYAADSLNVLGMVYFKQEKYENSERAFLTLAKEFPYSEHVGESWFWAAESANQQHRDQALVRKYRRKVFDEYPQSKHAPEAYFTYYTYSDYLQGQGPAMAHLKGMKERYPNTPFLVVANYLAGLDLKGETRDDEGMLVHHADVGAALSAFEEARQHFDFCYEHGLVDARDLEYMVNVRYRSMLERARGFVQVADQAEGAKREIYLQYSEQAYREVINDFSDQGSALVAFLHEDIPSQGVQEEAEFGLAGVYRRADKPMAAEALLDQMLERYQAGEVEKGFLPSRTWAMKGELSRDRGEYEAALACFDAAEIAADGQGVPTDKMLDLWILKASCHRELGQLDIAMSMLSKVVDADIASGERIRAMFQRAEIYELQGRRDLALRQLEATATKGGHWALQAKERLNRDFAFN